MARKTNEITITTPGKDFGKTFTIKEMSAKAVMDLYGAIEMHPSINNAEESQTARELRIATLLFSLGLL